MEAYVQFALYALLLLGVSAIAAYLPMARNLKDSQLHLLIALAAGIFLGLLLFMLLPEAIEECEHGDIDTHYAMMAVALGFLTILIINIALKEKHKATCGCECHGDLHGHRLTSMSSFIGLAIHAACDGLALAAMFMAGEEVGLMATIGLCIHKFVELFSLSSTMLLSDLGKRRSFRMLGAFSLITPIAGVAFFALFRDMEVEGTLGLPLAFAAGTLMYVTMCDMIPESFHRGKQEKVALALLIVGVAVMLAVALLFPHEHRKKNRGLTPPSYPRPSGR